MTRNSSPWLHRGPNPVLDAASDEDERSEVRARSGSRRALAPPASGDAHPAARGGRIDEKVRRAQALLDRLGPSDPRGRLIRVAIVRRDETLLDGLLAEAQRHVPEAPSRRRLSSHRRLKATGYRSDDD